MGSSAEQPERAAGSEDPASTTGLRATTTGPAYPISRTDTRRLRRWIDTHLSPGDAPAVGIRSVGGAVRKPGCGMALGSQHAAALEFPPGTEVPPVPQKRTACAPTGSVGSPGFGGKSGRSLGPGRVRNETTGEKESGAAKALPQLSGTCSRRHCGRRWPQTGQDGASPWFWKVLVTVRAVATGALDAGVTRAAGGRWPSRGSRCCCRPRPAAQAPANPFVFLSSSMRPRMGSSAWPAAPAGEVASR